MDHYLYRLQPPRPTFALDMDDEERAVMGRHAEYWTDLLRRGVAVVFGPVLDPAGSWGLAVVQVDSEDAVHALGRQDPAVSAGVATFSVFPMPTASSR